MFEPFQYDWRLKPARHTWCVLAEQPSLSWVEPTPSRLTLMVVFRASQSSISVLSSAVSCCVASFFSWSTNIRPCPKRRLRLQLRLDQRVYQCWRIGRRARSSRSCSRSRRFGHGLSLLPLLLFPSMGSQRSRGLSLLHPTLARAHWIHHASWVAAEKNIKICYLLILIGP